jgi:predicted O-methyltransferase YrrM
MELTNYLMQSWCNKLILEGNVEELPSQIIELINLSKNSKNAMEIGFNAGHSADMFLKNNPEMNLTSFDLGNHDYTLIGKEYIDKTFPGRHTLIIGDSRLSIPKYINDHPDKKFDFIFIDGGHDYEVAKLDIENCKNLAMSDSILIIDDTMHNPDGICSYNIGPNKAVSELIQSGLLVKMKAIDFCPGRGMTVGFYNI